MSKMNDPHAPARKFEEWDPAKNITLTKSGTEGSLLAKNIRKLEEQQRREEASRTKKLWEKKKYHKMARRMQDPDDESVLARVLRETTVKERQSMASPMACSPWSAFSRPGKGGGCPPYNWKPEGYKGWSLGRNENGYFAKKNGQTIVEKSPAELKKAVDLQSVPAPAKEEEAHKTPKQPADPGPVAAPEKPWKKWILPGAAAAGLLLLLR